ncbi:MAG: hypothetical protein COB02_13560 [Candidatus Cloacimonadota bacterium]|nr:MAG: hypothetical protein COB02_13560 [Candidatus Cloacimonadota bacterium]
MKILIKYILISLLMIPYHQKSFSFNFLKKIFSTRKGKKERKGFYYQTKKGDSFWSLSRRFNISEKRLKRANRVRNNILPLAKIYIPRSTYNELPKQIYEQHPHPRKKVVKYKVPKKVKTKKVKVYTKKKVTKKKSSPKSKKGFQFLWPIKSPILANNGKFGMQKNGTNNNGILLKVNKKEPVYASRSGLVIFSGKFKGYGNMVILDHLDNYFSLYIKLGSIKTKKQNVMVKSQKIIGYTSSFDKNNIFIFEVKKLNQSINPMKFLNKNKLN